MSDLQSASALAGQCAEQRERCLYTAAALFIWIRWLRVIRIGFVTLPIVFGAIASWDLLKGNNPAVNTLAAILALIAGLVPSVYAALKLDEHLPKASRLAGEYKNLEIVFSDLQTIGVTRPFVEFETKYEAARERLDKANSEAYTAPEFCFRSAKRLISLGDYSFGKN